MPSPSRGARSVALVGLGAWLATRGGLAIAGLAWTALLGVGAAVAALLSTPTRAALLPAIASTVVAWGGGMSLAFASALRALRLDREQGVVALASARGAGPGAFVRGRVVGLVAVLSVVVGGATLVACGGVMWQARGTVGVVGASAGAVAYAVAFSVTMAPVALATLGARSRAGGYLALVAVLSVPELLAPWTGRLLPRGWRELTSIPDALAAVREGVAHPVWAGAHAARAAAALVAVGALSALVVAARAARTRQAGADA